MKEELRRVVTLLVDEPEKVELSQSEENDRVFLLRVAPNDLGKVIGRQGRTARALRTLLGGKYELKVLDD